MQLSSKIKTAREIKGLTQVQLSQYSGVSLDSIKRYETKDNSNITIDNLKKIAEALDFELFYFLSDENVPKSSLSRVPYSQNIVPKSQKADSLVSLSQSNLPLADTLTNRSHFAELDKYDIINIPFFCDGKVSAGFGEQHIEGDIDYIPYSKSMLKARFNLAPQGILGIITAIGNSMSPTINEGDLLLFQCDGSKNEGGIYIVRIDGDYYVKRLQKLPKIRLLSDNSAYEPIEIKDLQEIEIIGRVVGIISSVRLRL